MLRNLKASPARLLLACSLCLLAMAFAVEAKIAWYGPVSGPGSEVRAAKALPSDVPQVADSGENLSNPFHLPVSLTFLALIAVFSLSYISNTDRRKLSVCATRIFSAGYFSSLPLRAPPARF
jgi:hypothetical protein